MIAFKKHGLSFEKEVEKINSKDFKVAEELIEDLFCDMAKLGTKYGNDRFFDLPYTYMERQLDSILLPSLSKLCDGLVLAEVPTIRKCNNGRFNVEESNGRIDYWCVYKNYSFVIEMKHSYDCFTTTKTRKRTVIERWIKMNEQLQSIESNIKKTYEENTKGVIRIGLHFITSYSDKNPDEKLIKDFKESVPKTFLRFQQDLSKRYPKLKPDLLLCWKIPTSIVLDGYATFPGLWCVAKRYPAIIHKGAKKKVK